MDSKNTISLFHPLLMILTNLDQRQIPSMVFPSVVWNFPKPQILSSWKSPSKIQPFDSFMRPRPYFVSRLSIPSQYYQQSSRQSKFVQSKLSWKTTGLSLQTLPKPLNQSWDHWPSQASFPPSQKSLPYPSILLFLHCPSQYPPSWQKNFPFPFRMPPLLNPSYRLPVSYSQITYSSSMMSSDLDEWSGVSSSLTSTIVELYLFFWVLRLGVVSFSSCLRKKVSVSLILGLTELGCFEGDVSVCPEDLASSVPFSSLKGLVYFESEAVLTQ